MANKGERSSINITKQTKDDLDSIKRTGQSYNGLIQDLIELWKKEHGDSERSQGGQDQR